MEKETLVRAFKLMCTARKMADLYDENRQICKYVHSTSKGHEAIQLATAFMLRSYDYASPYYRDESILLGLGIEPYELMLQLLAKADDPFSGGRSYYSHPALKRAGFPIIPHQSSATGMQAIPATGMAHAIAYMESQKLHNPEQKPVVLCSLGDGSVTEGEVSEALQMAVLKHLPIIFLIQDNEWGISATSKEMRAMDAYDFASGFPGIKRIRVDGSNFVLSYNAMKAVFEECRNSRGPILVHAKVPLLGHHTSGVRKEWYRSKEDLDQHALRDPYPIMVKIMADAGFDKDELKNIRDRANQWAQESFDRAVDALDPKASNLMEHEFAATPILHEMGNRSPKDGQKVVMVDAALHACEEILAKHPEALLYGQDVGGTLGGVFREAATLAQKFGEERVFNTPIQEAYIVGSTVGMSAVGCKPIVEIQFADYIWSSVNQLVVEISKSCYLTQGKFPIQSLIRIPCGAYGGGGPYHSGCIESAILNIRGIKVVYPSNAADMKGLMKAAFYDPNPVIIFEHKGLYWSKVQGTEEAKTIEPDADYVVPIGKGRIALAAQDTLVEYGESVAVITYGMGVYWATEAAKSFPGQVEVIDLRSLYPMDEALAQEVIAKHGKCLLLTEEPLLNSFIQSLAGRLSQSCFKNLDAPIICIGAENLPAVPLNVEQEKLMLPSAHKVQLALSELLHY